METIKKKKGVITIEQIAKQHFISDRQLERNFKRYIGISPKEYAGFIRYQFAVQVLQTKGKQESLLGIALDTGFYDHAHLTNEIRKYSGILPSQIQNVGFLQTDFDVQD
jgi:transcriptional regulator GlxA family with amidase domain